MSSKNHTKPGKAPRVSWSLTCPQLLCVALPPTQDPGKQTRRGAIDGRPHTVSKLTGVGVVHISIVNQHFVKEDDAPVAGERLLGEPRRERHQRRHWNPWSREDMERVQGSEIRAWITEASVPGWTGYLTILLP